MRRFAVVKCAREVTGLTWFYFFFAVTDMLIAMLGICSQEELDEEEEALEEEPVAVSPGEEPEPELTGALDRSRAF